MTGTSVKLPLLLPHSLILCLCVCLFSGLCKVSVFSCTQWLLLFLRRFVVLQAALQQGEQPHKRPPVVFSLPVLSRLSDLKYAYEIDCTKIALLLCFPLTLYDFQFKVNSIQHLQRHTKTLLLLLCLCFLFFYNVFLISFA